jgi:hypothetical protein
MERASVNGVELEYELKGSGEPVLLIHGSHIGRSFLPLLAQPSLLEKYTLIRYHRRGFLDSAPARGPVSIKDQAADARALLEHLHMSRALLWRSNCPAACHRRSNARPLARSLGSSPDHGSSLESRARAERRDR